MLALGLHLEAQLLPALERLAESGATLWTAGDWLEPEDLIATTEAGGSHDPHVWMDLELWAAITGAMGQRLRETLPESAAQIESRERELLADLQQADAWAARAFQSIPARGRVLVTSHDAFGYLGRRYGIEVHGLQGLSTESEAGLARVEALVDLLVERQVPALFGESTISSEGLRALLEGAAARGHNVALGGELFSDATGPVGSGADSVLGMFEHNVRTIVLGLGGVPGERDSSETQTAGGTR